MNGEETDLQSFVTDNVDTNSKDDTESIINESTINSYFSHCNFLSKNIISEQRLLVKFLEDRWNALDCTRREPLLDLLFVEDDVRQQQPPSRKDDMVFQESFPRLYLNSGQKINVDFENDLWTWRDEHSGPFSWMSRSQQDLTLADLETENISKPQPKTLRVDTENQENLKDAEQQFSHPANCWSRDIIDDYRKAEKHITLSPCASIEFPGSELKQQQPCEEVNEAFEDVKDDILVATSSSHPTSQDSCTDGKLESKDPSSDSADKKKGSSKERRKRSPSPKKILRSSSLRRSPSKCSDQGEQQLISKKNDDSYEEQNSFSNPLVETQWSSFVGENGKTEFNNQDIPLKNVHSLPTAQVMDRGVEQPTGSPYQVQRDNINLISPIDSPAQRGHLYTVTNDLEGWSAESTPDHTTHLLKGMESDTKKSESSHQFKPAVLDRYETDEILTVENQGADIKISTESGNKRDSDIPTSGFDFLDNW